MTFQAMDAKPIIKEALQAELGLPIDRTIPLIGFIGRLEEQKGSDILMEAIPEFINENIQLVVLVSIKLLSSVSDLFFFILFIIGWVVARRELEKRLWRSNWSN